MFGSDFPPECSDSVFVIKNQSERFCAMSEQLSFRPERRPNVIWIFGDQHRAHALSYRGRPQCVHAQYRQSRTRGDAL